MQHSAVNWRDCCGMAVALRLEYDAGKVPSGGWAVHASVAVFAKCVNKDPAGHAFQDFALKQAGLYGRATQGPAGGVGTIVHLKSAA